MITSPFAQIFAIAISNGVSGMTKRWSIVPCSRSRTMAAPESTIASIVMKLMIPMTLVNQLVSTFGLNSMRTTRLTGDSAVPSARERKSLISVMMICCA